MTDDIVGGGTHFDGCEMLKLPVWVLDDMLWSGPIRGAEDPDLVSLVSGEQL